MGNNAAYTAFEHTVVAVYDHGVLDKKLLKKLMEPYRDTDIDSGGKEGLTSKDGLEVEEIVIKVWGLEVPKRPRLPKNYKDWTPEQDRENEEYQEKIGELFNSITDEFGWC